MEDISLHLLDIIQNSIHAGAGLIEIAIEKDVSGNELLISVKDNGKGMDPETIGKVTDPFYTTRETRKVGLGIPLFKASAEMCGGYLEVRSEPGRGTEIDAVFRPNHIDCLPLGDVEETMVAVVAAHPETRFVLNCSRGSQSFRLDTREVEKQLDGVPINHFEVLTWLKEYIREGLNILEV